MDFYGSEQDAVFGLHKQGYINDFHLFGNDLLWTQQKIFIRVANFSIIEYHRFLKPDKPGREIIVFAVALKQYNVKGIMMNDYPSYTPGTPAVIVGKIKKMLLA